MILEEQLLMSVNKSFLAMYLKNGDAEGQYSFPYNNTLHNCKIRPNKSFDLSRLSTTIIEHFDEDENKDLYKLLKLWASDKYGNFLMEEEEDFDLYKNKAKKCKISYSKKSIK